MNRKRSTLLPYRGFYGWIIVMVAFVSMAFWIGIRTSFSVFYVALLEEFAWNRGDSAGVQSLALIICAVSAPLVGGLIDRFGPRRVVVPGILVLIFCLVMCATIKMHPQCYIFYGILMGSGITCIAGLIFDHTSSYQGAFILAISGMLCSCFFRLDGSAKKNQTIILNFST
jgi:MFS family permease